MQYICGFNFIHPARTPSRLTIHKYPRPPLLLLRMMITACTGLVQDGFGFSLVQHVGVICVRRRKLRRAAGSLPSSKPATLEKEWAPKWSPDPPCKTGKNPWNTMNMLNTLNEEQQRGALPTWPGSWRPPEKSWDQESSALNFQMFLN